MPNIHHAVLIGANVETVYKALTTSEGLSGWWTPGSAIKTGTRKTAHFPFGPGYFKEMEITSEHPFESLTWTCIHGADEWLGTTLSFTLQQGDKKSLTDTYPEMQGQAEQLTGDSFTLLTFQHNGWQDYTRMFAECNYTWARFLESLKLFCETGKGRPWPGQHGGEVIQAICTVEV